METNYTIQVVLFALAFFLVYQILNNKETSQENLDAIPNASITTYGPVNSSGTGAPVSTGAPSAAITGKDVPSPLTSVEETLLAAAPPKLSSSFGEENVFAPTPVDMDALFDRKTSLDPSELIPKVQDSELYAGLQPDPRLNQNFLNNRWSLGIETSISKRNPVHDIRGVPPNPIAAGFTAIWNAPTILPDVHRKSICDVS